MLNFEITKSSGLRANLLAHLNLLPQNSKLVFESHHSYFMKHSLPVYLAFFVFLGWLPLTSCKHKQETGLATIDVIAGLKQEKEFRLSELVDSIEYIKLETSKECLVSNASKVIGKKYILLLNHRPQQIMLFDRSGKFLRLI